MFLLLNSRVVDSDKLAFYKEIYSRDQDLFLAFLARSKFAYKPETDQNLLTKSETDRKTAWNGPV